MRHDRSATSDRRRARGHASENAAGERPHGRELGAQVVGEPIDHAGSSALGGLPVHDRLTDRPVQAEHLGVDDAMRAQLRVADLGL
ncbi:hypothetical protein AB0H36_35985 [Kribbella sp. NPDC050820]|uniref:hypothetical protein n=1 Tax=Kribbella sp. NPDC050820 TaxID=3155408 RepID=UPI0033D12E18